MLILIAGGVAAGVLIAGALVSAMWLLAKMADIDEELDAEALADFEEWEQELADT